MPYALRRRLSSTALRRAKRRNTASNANEEAAHENANATAASTPQRYEPPGPCAMAAIATAMLAMHATKAVADQESHRPGRRPAGPRRPEASRDAPIATPAPKYS